MGILFLERLKVQTLLVCIMKGKTFGFHNVFLSRNGFQPMCFGTPYTNSKNQSCPNVLEVHRPIATVVSGMLSVLFGFWKEARARSLFRMLMETLFQISNVQCKKAN